MFRVISSKVFLMDTYEDAKLQNFHILLVIIAPIQVNEDLSSIRHQITKNISHINSYLDLSFIFNSKRSASTRRAIKSIAQEKKA